jgi:hypothetical protein
MALLRRRAREEAPQPPPAPDITDERRARIEREAADPATGELRRRQLRRKLAGIVTRGATDLEHPGARPTDNLVMTAAGPDELRQHRETVAAEVAACEERIAELSGRIAVTPATVASAEFYEARREVRLLKELVEDLRADTEPVTAYPSGRRVTAEVRRALAARARSYAADKFEQAERCAAEGDHRRATRLRVDALRARQVVEFNDALREQLRGYTTPWS